MWALTIWRLLWELWVTAPGCSGACAQGRGECNCNMASRSKPGREERWNR